jgi:hypothetical protein
MTSTALIDDEEIELWEDTQSREKIEEADEEAEEATDEVYG